MLWVTDPMSMDVWRDLEHSEIMKIHKAYGADRQGPKLSVGQLEKDELALRVLDADEICQEKKIVGNERHQFIIKECGLAPDTGDRAIRKFLKHARELLANDKTPKAKTKAPVQPINDPHKDIKLARTRANYLALTPEAHCRLVKDQRSDLYQPGATPHCHLVKD